MTNKSDCDFLSGGCIYSPDGLLLTPAEIFIEAEDVPEGVFILDAAGEEVSE